MQLRVAALERIAGFGFDVLPDGPAVPEVPAVDKRGRDGVDDARLGDECELPKRPVRSAGRADGANLVCLGFAELELGRRCWTVLRALDCRRA